MPKAPSARKRSTPMATTSCIPGTLAAGGTVSGNLYFEGDVVKVLYENAFIGRGSDVSWDIV